MAKKKTTASRQPKGKVPGMKDVLTAHNKVEKARKFMVLTKEQAAARKKEYEGTVADLSKLLSEIKSGQTRMDF